MSKLIIFGHRGGARPGQEGVRHHHIIILAGGEGGGGFIQHHHRKNMGFVPMFSIAAAGIIRAATIYMEGVLVSVQMEVVRSHDRRERMHRWTEPFGEFSTR